MLLDSSLYLWKFLDGVVDLRLLVLHDFLRTAHPRALAEDFLHVFCHDDLFLYQEFSQRIVTILVFHQDVLGTGILLVHHLEYFLVDFSCRCLRVWALERVFALVVIADVWQSLTHTEVSHHAVCTLGSTLQVVHRTRRDMSCKQFLCCTSTHQRAHLVEHLLLGGDLSLLR